MCERAVYIYYNRYRSLHISELHGLSTVVYSALCVEIGIVETRMLLEGTIRFQLFNLCY